MDDIQKCNKETDEYKIKLNEIINVDEFKNI